MDFASFDSQEMPGGGWVVKPYTVYVSPYFVYNGDGYVQDISPDRFTKHYYAGSERIASRLNREGQNATEHTTSTIYSPTAAYAPVLVNLQAALSAFGLNDQLDTDPAGYPPNPIEAPEDCEEQFGNDQMEIERCLCLHFPAEAALQSIECSSFEPVYWYHPDYLGHTDFVTDRTGQPYQHFFYAPFGDALLSQHSGTGYYNTPYRFNAKELDSETGLMYYGARYYMPKESVWLSVDPLAHKYPGLSGYNFVANNPIMLVDPDGRSAKKPDDYIVNNDGVVVDIVPTKEPHRILDLEGNELEFHDKEIDQKEVELFEVGDKLVHFLKPDQVNQMITEGTPDLMRNPYVFLTTKMAYTLLGSYSSLDFTFSQLLPINKSPYLLETGGLIRPEYIQGGFYAFPNINKAYNLYDAGNFLWGNAQKSMHIPLVISKFGAQANESFQDSEADQRAITEGYNYKR